MICDKCGKKVDAGRLIKSIGFLCDMCLFWATFKLKENKFNPDWSSHSNFLSDLLVLLNGGE